jgi:hypothetical protein
MFLGGVGSGEWGVGNILFFSFPSSTLSISSPYLKILGKIRILGNCY